jgi:hypothetical protein
MENLFRTFAPSKPSPDSGNKRAYDRPNPKTTRKQPENRMGLRPVQNPSANRCRIAWIGKRKIGKGMAE